INLQTSFLTPPFGFALFYLRGVAPKEIRTKQIYRGVAPFIAIQIFALLLIAYFPELAIWLPQKIY
ncbi:MAG: TRAP transporter large permease subunit, partial [Gammaproteobacteria bacterium]|nr:TRAP transporter large permease subunit [Gammaproteobacteria bacterium]